MVLVEEAVGGGGSALRDEPKRRLRRRLHDGRRCYEYLFACVKINQMDSEILTYLLKFIEYFLDYLSALARTLFLDLCRNSFLQ